MRRSENLAHIEKGYGFFPYLIIRKRSGIYFQLPIHRHFKDILHLEGITWPDQNYNSAEEYEETLINHITAFWERNTKGSNTIFQNMCLVINENKGYYFSGDGTTKFASIPSGGWLYTFESELIQTKGEHFITL
jgi:hypothetical protein